MRKIRAKDFNPASIKRALYDGPQKKTPRSVQKKTSRSVQKETQQLLKRLLRKKSATRSSITLAERIEACSSNERCRSPVCPVCARVAQKRFASLVHRFLQARQHRRRKKIFVISLVPSTATTKPGKLSVAADKLAMRRVKHAMKKAEIRWFVGAWDWSRNEHREGKFAPYWALHLHGFTASCDRKQLRKNLKKRFPKTDEIPRPVKVKHWDGNRRAARYSLKATFTRRISVESERFDPRSGKTSPCRNTDKQPLRSGEVRELFPHIDALGNSGRIVLIGARIRNGIEGDASIESISKKSRSRRRA